MKAMISLLITFALFLFYGCSDGGIFSGGSRENIIDRQEVIAIVEEMDESEPSDPGGITVYIASQILSSAYAHYKELGMTVADIDRITDDSFAENLKLLYNDLEFVIGQNNQ